MHRREEAVISRQDESGSRNRGTAVEQRMGKTRTVADDDKILINRDLVLVIRSVPLTGFPGRGASAPFCRPERLAAIAVARY